MAKRKRKSLKNESNILKYIAYFLAVVALVLSSLVGGYYLGYEDAKDKMASQEKQEKQKRLALIEKLEKTTKSTSESVNDRLKEVLKKESKFQIKKEISKVKEYADASHEYDNNTLAKPPLRAKKETKQSSDKPKLAIIIDDVSISSHVNAIKSLGLPITMSFLPPSKSRPDSAKLAAKEDFYMVHLPMEAQSYSAEEPITLRIYDSQKTILSRIKKIKLDFPKVMYINNHTGSKFTANEIAMNRLITALNTYHISFIDSRTTAETKAPEVLKNFGLKYVARDVFLDHKSNKAYIVSQIKKAIQIAKDEGSAIAIGHPHANTIMALHESKNLFKDVDLVYVNKVY